MQYTHPNPTIQPFTTPPPHRGPITYNYNYNYNYKLQTTTSKLHNNFYSRSKPEYK